MAEASATWGKALQGVDGQFGNAVTAARPRNCGSAAPWDPPAGEPSFFPGSLWFSGRKGLFSGTKGTP